MDSVEKYRRRVRKAVKGLDECRVVGCKRCPYRKKGCKETLFVEAAELLDEYLKNLKGICESE